MLIADVIKDHPYEFVAGAWLFSLVMDQCPDLPKNASFFAVWAHNVGQVLGANLSNIIRNMKLPLP